jgi:hypothetical protein
VEKTPRNGQWVSTSRKILGAHTTPDGRTVGIYRAAGTQLSPVKDGETIRMEKVFVPGAVFIVAAEDGQDLYTLDGREAKPVSFSLEELPDLQPVTEADHLPESRRAHLPKGMKLPA